uniref:Uncharacterized protein n=1 Tax=Anguilla anguilla TaxID=7936 RepID=A0A0E9S9Z7_ANGAN
MCINIALVVRGLNENIKKRVSISFLDKIHYNSSLSL